MSINIPTEIDKNEFEKKILKKLNNEKFSMYKSKIIENYKCPKTATKYTLKSSITNEELNNINYILKRIGYNNSFKSLNDIAKYLRWLSKEKKYIIIFAYNGTGKTRLSCEFKAIGQELNEESGEKSADTFYYNAFTEDLFQWDNDIENDTTRNLKINVKSRFFNGLEEYEMDTRIRKILQNYVDFDFKINPVEQEAEKTQQEKNSNTQEKLPNITFFKNILIDGNLQRVDNIKISRGEENIFIWCFFLAFLELINEDVEAYNWVKYIYIDDPISSLDDNNVIAIASHIARIIKKSKIKTIISSHHTLFFNVLCNEIGNAEQLFLQKDTKNNCYILKDTSKTPFFHHIALLKELKRVADSGELYTYHFNILRNILEKTASFHGFAHFSSCIKKNADDPEGIVYKRMLDLMSHGNYSLFSPKEMVPENKEYFKKILSDFLNNYKFNENLFKDLDEAGEADE